MKITVNLEFGNDHLPILAVLEKAGHELFAHSNDSGEVVWISADVDDGAVVATINELLAMDSVSSVELW